MCVNGSYFVQVGSLKIIKCSFDKNVRFFVFFQGISESWNLVCFCFDDFSYQGYLIVCKVGGRSDKFFNFFGIKG